GEDAHSVICTASFVANDSLYHLSSTDNCGTDAGVSLSEVTDDIDGDSRPSGGGYDVGADERVGGGLARLIARGDESGEEEGGGGIVIYPHPVTDRGTIRVVVAEGWKDVWVRVYDGASRQVANLMFESASEPGEYELEWSTEGLASGIYIVVVESGGERIVEQVIVEKKN
ncbi:MAG: T9SS type A sorting domain-containing protein, partial [Candidatus Kapaibacterium sp.]